MTAAMLVLDPIFEADLPPEQYAYRQGRNAQQAVTEVEETDGLSAIAAVPTVQSVCNGIRLHDAPARGGVLPDLHDRA